MFRFSLLYLAVLFAALPLDGVVARIWRPDTGRMSVAMTEDRRPGDTDRHRRQRGKNLFMAAFLLALAAIFFLLTLVRMGGQT